VPKTIEAVWRIDATRLVTAITRVTHNIRIAEETGLGIPGHCAPALVRRTHPRRSRAWLMNPREQKLRAKRVKQI